jgi:hypothetical protein
MKVRTGDRVIVASRRLARPPRTGSIEEVRGARSAARYRVHWDDGRTSVIVPSGGALLIDRDDAGRAETAGLFRLLNNRIHDAEQPWAGEHDFVCECGDETCTRAIRMSDPEYAALRSDPRSFAVFPGHEDETAILIRSDRYVVVRREQEQQASTPQPPPPAHAEERARTKEARRLQARMQRLLQRVRAWRRGHHRRAEVDAF